MFEFGCHAFLPNWLFWCRFFFSILFLRGHWCPLLPSLDEENLVGFQLHPARTFRRFFDGKKSHWRPQGPHWPPFMYQHHNTPFLIPDKKWVRRKSNVWKGYSVYKWMYVLYGVCVFVCVCLQGGMFLCVCEAVMKGGGQGPTWPHEGSPNLHN